MVLMRHLMKGVGIIGTLVGAKKEVESPELRKASSNFAQTIQELLPEADTARRIAGNYGILGAFAGMVRNTLNVCMPMYFIF